jgi:hypothetical protein
VVSFFKDRSPATVFGLVIVSIGVRAFFWKQPPAIIASPSDGLIYYLLDNLSFLSGSIAAILYHLIVVVQALRLNYALNDIRMFSKPSYTTALAYVLLTALLPEWNNISSALIINSMLIWLIYRIIRLYNTQNPKTLVYNIGLITGCSILLYFSSFPLILVALFAVAFLRPFRFNEWIILIIGIITPVYFLAGWLYLHDKFNLVVETFKIFQLTIIRPSNLLFTVIIFAFSAVVTMAGIFMWQSNSGKMVIQARKVWSILFLMLILLLPPVYLIKNAWPNALFLATVPAAAFVSNTFFYPKRNIGPALLFWLFVALIVYVNWFVIKI